MNKRKIRAKTCFMLGIVAGVLYAISGFMASIGQGGSSFLYISAIGFTGAMLLFLSTTEGGAAKKVRRVRLLGLFFLLILSYPYLPPLSTLAGALVVPLFVKLYSDEPPLVITLLVLELLYFAVQTAALVYTPLLLAVPILLVILGLARAFAAWRLYKQEADRRYDPGEDVRPGR